tara:strand:- start:12 stop:527 length:516 start_codon:yes stop_codon:yes gene_type:complete
MNIWQKIIFSCLAVIVTLLIYQNDRINSEMEVVKERVANIHKMQIDSSYRQYVQDFINNDFEAIASHFVPPVDFKLYNLTAETNEDVINQYIKMKANIQQGYAYSLIDQIEILKTNDNNFLLCSDYSRYNSNDQLLFQGRTHYVYVYVPDVGWKMNSLDSKERDTKESCRL